jgi:predicted branched-subunit amino acid permease
MAALSFPAWTVALALLGVGSLARDVGHPIGAAMASTLLIWAGPAQVIFYAGLASGMAPAAIAAAVSLSSIRFLPMTMSLLPLLRRPGQGLGEQLLAAHFVAVTVWSESMRRLPDVPSAHRAPFYFGFAGACVVLSTLATGIGYHLMATLPVALAAGLLFLTPVFFTLSVTGGARRAADWLAIGLGFSLQPVMQAQLGDGLDLLGVGVVGGTLAFLVGRLSEGRGIASQMRPGARSGPMWR